jgi:hypothetical protein
MESADWVRAATKVKNSIDRAEGVAVVGLHGETVEKGHQYNRGHFSGTIGSMEMQRRNNDWNKQDTGGIAKKVYSNNSIYDAVFVAWTGVGVVGGGFKRPGATKTELDDAVVQARNEFIDNH